MTNLEWLMTLSEEEFADWLYGEWLNHMQYRWSSSRGGLVYWLKADRKDEPTISKMEQVEDEPQTDVFFREPTAEERKAVAEYIESISIPTGVNIFDLMDEPQTDCAWK